MGAAALVAIRKAKILNSESFKTGWDFNSSSSANNQILILFEFFPLVNGFWGKSILVFVLIDRIFPCCPCAALGFCFGSWICLRALQPLLVGEMALSAFQGHSCPCILDKRVLFPHILKRRGWEGEGITAWWLLVPLGTFHVLVLTASTDCFTPSLLASKMEWGFFFFTSK